MERQQELVRFIGCCYFQ